MSFTLLEAGILGVAVLNALTLTVTVAAKGSRGVKRRWQTSKRAKLEAGLEAFLSGRAGGLMIRWPRSWEWDILATLMSERLARVERIGAERERLSEAAVEIGLARRYAGMLHSPRRWYRARAAENLGHFGGEEAVALLGRLLDDRDETVRAVAARALARIGTGETARLLARTLEDPSELTRLRVAENLQRVGPAAEEPLAQVLSRQNGAGAVLAAQVLGNLGADVARAELARAARGAASTDLRAQATLALGKISNPGDLPTLLGAAEDPAWPVRAQAANALGMVGDPEAVPVLRGLVSDGEWWVRLNAARALAGLGTPGEGALLELLGSPDRFARDRAAATLESEGVLDRWVGEMAAPGETGETARRGVRAIIHAGAERYPRSLLASIPQGPEKDALCAELAGTAGR